MKVTARLKAEDDYREAIVWLLKKADSYLVEYCDDKSSNWEGKLFYGGENNQTDESKENSRAKQLKKALVFAEEHVKK